MRISERIRYVGVNDFDKQKFENQWPLTKGVTYNSYLIVDEKVALIDTSAAGFSEQFLANIREEIGERPIDYLIVNHMEPDHSSLMTEIRKNYPEIRVVANATAVPMIAGFQGITDNIKVVKDNDHLDLGSCRLVFKMTPMVHWPETMMTWLEEEMTLFTGDAFGCFGAVTGSLTDGFDEFKDEMMRYYACIVGKYGQPVQAALMKVSDLSIKRICSTHGPVWEKEISKVVALYDSMSRYVTEKGVTIVYASMYGNTGEAAHCIKKELDARGIKNEIHDLNYEDVSFSYRDVFKYDTIVAGSPTYNANIFPQVETFLLGVKQRMVKNHRFAGFGSYTWASSSVKLMNKIAEESGMKLLSDGVIFNQGFSTEKFDINKFVDEITKY